MIRTKVKVYISKSNFTCFHSTLSIISAPGAELSVIGGRNNEIYCEIDEKEEKEKDN